MLLLALLKTCSVWGGLQVHLETYLWFSFCKSYLPILPQKMSLTLRWHTLERNAHTKAAAENSPLSQASHEDHLCQCLLGDLWVLVALEVQGAQLVLGPPKPIKNSSQICFRGINHIKTHQFTHKECKPGWKKLS